MSGSLIEDDWDFPSVSNVNRTVVLVGRAGTGKSATGNSILGRKVFKSAASPTGLTTTSELQSTELEDGQVINVIDTPGLFDLSVGPEVICKEIVKCVDLAKDGLHAILLVLTHRIRYEDGPVQSLQTMFGSKIRDYLIVVFTGGDDFDEDADVTFEMYLSQCCSEPLKELLNSCKNRCVLFDNKTKDLLKKEEQRQQLLELVDKVVQENGGRPYSDELFKELKKGAMKLYREVEKASTLGGHSEGQTLETKAQQDKSYEELLQRISEMVEARLSETTRRLEAQLAAEQAARLKSEELAIAAQQRSAGDIEKLRMKLEKAKRETDELKKQAADKKCTIL